MDARVTALEQIAISTKDFLSEIKAELREMRAELRAELRESRAELKTEIHELRTETRAETIGLRQDIKELRKDQQADFRLTFGALISVALGLAALMAHGFKWF